MTIPYRTVLSAGRVTAALLALLVAALIGSIDAPKARAASVPSGFVDEQVVNGLNSPTAMAFAPDGRLFVAQQGGSLRVIKNGQLLAQPFLTVNVNSSGERGLLGVAFDPAFASNGFVYVYYTATSPAIHNRISRFTASGDIAVAGSEVVLFDLDNLSTATNHNGGAIHFGADGKLYVGVGDNANSQNAQTLNNVLGKLLRLNADGTIPADNPYYNTATGKNRAIWALGLRNPFAFNVQPGTGRIFINDVGEGSWEEINDGIAGSNYGWPATEGPTTNPAYRSPVFAYNHSQGCAITGGAFYNPATNTFGSAYTGDYFYADYCGGWIRRLDVATGQATGFATGVSALVDIQVHSDGSLYYLERGNLGRVGRIRTTAGQPPAISQQPQSLSVASGAPATFTVTASGSAPLSYQWQRNGTNIAGATSASYTIASAQASDNGAVFRASVTNSFGTATSSGATLTVTSNTAPAGAITSPASGTTYAAGDTISYAGTATDTEDGTLPAAAYTWQVDFHHDTHAHPFMSATTGATSGSFTIPTSGETAANVWYRISLTVRDSDGATHTVFRDVLPRTAAITLQSAPAGLQLTLDGQPVTAPHTVTSVVGITRAIGAVSPQSSGGSTYTFTSWSGGGASTQNITTPATNTTYTASFAASTSQTITFDDRAGADAPLTGEYPAGLIRWEGNAWWHASPWRSFTTNSVSANGPAGHTSGTFTFLQPRRLVQLTAFNGGSVTSTVTLRCTGQPDKVQSVAVNTIATIVTGWTANCASVFVGSSNGWNTNFDDFVINNAAATATPTATSTPTRTPTPVATNTPTPVATNTPANTPTLVATNTPTPVATNTPTPVVPTSTPTPVAPTSTHTVVPSSTPTLVAPTPTATHTPTAIAPTSTPTPTATPAATHTPTAVAPTPTPTPTPGATITPAPTSTAPAVGRFALSFDGVNDVATAPDSASLDITGAFTIEAWVRFDTLPKNKWQTIAFKQIGTGGIAYALYYHNGIEFRFHSGTSEQVVEDYRPLQPGVWYHIAGVYSGGSLKTFVNGQLTASKAASGTVSTSNFPLQLGNNTVWNNEQLDGAIDEFRLSRNARYTNAFTPPPAFAVDGNTVALWRFNEGTGQTSADASPNGNTLRRGTTTAAESSDPAWVSGR